MSADFRKILETCKIMKKFIQKIKDFWYNIYDQYVLYFNDKKMKKLFPKIIKEQDNDKESFFNEQNF